MKISFSESFPGTKISEKIEGSNSLRRYEANVNPDIYMIVEYDTNSKNILTVTTQFGKTHTKETYTISNLKIQSFEGTSISTLMIDSAKPIMVNKNDITNLVKVTDVEIIGGAILYNTKITENNKTYLEISFKKILQ
jgi:hypothetical protein